MSSDYSILWSTSNIPTMDAAAGMHRDNVGGRRKLRIGSLAFASCLTVQCRVAAASLAGGILVFFVFLAVGTVLLANPLRHFEVYLGQWSMSGPGRAFRLIPVFDGIGWAICINAIVRAIQCAVIAAIAMLYVSYTIRDDILPFTYCRDFEFRSYSPVKKYIVQDFSSMLSDYRNITRNNTLHDKNSHMNIKTRFENIFKNHRVTTKLQTKDAGSKSIRDSSDYANVDTCKETFLKYPTMHETPAYNFFYIEIMRFSSDHKLLKMNVPLMTCVCIIWALMWGFMIVERLINQRLIYNNVQLWFIVVPWVWTVVLLTVCVVNLVNLKLYPNFRVGGSEVLSGLSQGFQTALYIHSAGVGTEIVHGKGLNTFATTHIDPKLNDENVGHSVFLLLLAMLQASGVTACALLDYVHEQNHGSFDMHETIIWVLPMYSKCATLVNYSRFVSTIIFGGLAFTNTVTAYNLLKTALHTIFEYKVKLVYYEQLVVAILILCCTGISMIFVTSLGVAILESVDAMMTGITTPLVCLLELIGFVYIYRSTDFISDINVANEDNSCGYRIGPQWKTIPIITGILIILKIVSMCYADMPSAFISVAVLPLLLVVCAVPLQAGRNAFKFLRTERPHR